MMQRMSRILSHTPRNLSGARHLGGGRHLSGARHLVGGRNLVGARSSICARLPLLHARHGSGAAGDSKPDVGPGSTAYTILGVSPDAELTDLKASYRNLARQWHPDTGRDGGGEDIFPAISSSYQILSNPAQRAVYDKLHGESVVRSLLSPANFEGFWGRTEGTDRIKVAERYLFFGALPPISPICRTPLFPYLTFYACFSRSFSSPTRPFLPYVAPHFSHISPFIPFSF